MRPSVDTRPFIHRTDLLGSRLLCALVAFVVPFQLQYNYAINAFYAYGANYRDAGWFARLLWHNTWRLINPHDAATYFAVHFTPLFVPLTYLSSLLPTHAVEFYAAILATIYAGLAVAMYSALCACARPAVHWHFAALAVVALGFSFTGVVMQGIQLLHYEYAIPLTMFAFLMNLVRQRLRLAIFFLVLMLSIREDAGFHAAAVLGLIVLIKYAEHRSLDLIQLELSFLLIAFGYSAFAWWMTHYLSSVYRIPGSAFEMIYSGSPPYAHLSWPKLAGRLHTMFAQRIYCWAPALITLFWAIRTRNPYLVVGFVANIPWFVLNWTAVWNGAGVLYTYYAFPFVISMGWPVVAAMWRHGPVLPTAVVRETLLLQTAVVCIGLVAWNAYTKSLDFGPDYLARFGSVWLQNETATREKVREFDQAINARPEELGTIMADEAIMSLVTDPARAIIEMGHDTQAPVNTVAYFRDFGPQHDAVLNEVRARHLPYHYCILSTKICVYTDRAPESLSTFAGLLTSIPGTTDLK